MAFPPNVWNQLKNLTADDLISALLSDGWVKDPTCKGAILVYLKKDQAGKIINRVGIHYHSKKTYGAKLLNALIDSIGWTGEDLFRLKLAKK
jgi:predicted RNA binding protein YcfA (HicA-like mRNA interferase family)